MIKSIISFIFLLIIFSANCQNQEIITSEIVGKLISKPSKFPFLIIALPTSDCYKCRMPLSQVISRVKKRNVVLDKTKSVLVTDDYSFAKNFLDDNEISMPISVIKKINQAGQLCENGKSAIYILQNSEIGHKYEISSLNGEKIESMVRLLSTSTSTSIKNINSNKEQDTSLSKELNVAQKPFAIIDSVFSTGSYQVVNVKNNIAFFDEKLQKIAFLKSTTSFTYKRPQFKNYERIKSSLNNDIDTNKYKLLSFNETKKWASISQLPLIHINNIISNKDTVYCFFTANRYYQNLVDDSEIMVIPHDFIAKKNALNINRFSTINDLSSYDSYIPFNLIKDKGKDYIMLNVGSKFMTAIPSNDGFWIKIVKLDTTKSNNKSYALANVKFEDSKPKIEQIDSLTQNGERFIVFENSTSKVVCSLQKDTSYKNPIKEQQGHFYLNTTYGFNYLYTSHKKSNNIYAVVYRNDKDGIHVADIDIQNKKVILDKKLPINEAADEIIFSNNSYLIFGKKMINEDYNIGEMYIRRISAL